MKAAMKRVEIATIAASNYWPQVRALAGSLRRHDPDARVHALIIDATQAAIPEAEAAGIVVHTLAPLQLPDLNHLAARYTITELCTAVKARFLRHLFDQQRLDRVIFFDPDILFFESVQPVWERLHEFDILLTPHFLDPSEPENPEQEVEFLRLGTFNLGFIGLRDTANARKFLHWWDQRTMQYGVEGCDGVFTDQQWVNLVPGMFRRVGILEHPGLNVNYFNLHGRRLARDGNRFLLNGQPLVFFHFHKFRPQKAPLDYFRQHADPAIAEALFGTYLMALREASLGCPERASFSYGVLADGQPFPALLRQACRMLGAEADHYLCNGNGPLPLDEIGRRLVQPGRVASYTRALAYHERRRGQLGSPEGLIAAYRQSFWKRLQVDLWFYLFGPQTLKFPISWVEPRPLLRLGRRLLGSGVRALRSMKQWRFGRTS